MREGAPRGAALHEVGHLLGLAHEMDRQGCPDAQSWTEEKVKPKRSAAKSDEEHRFAIGGFNMLQDAAASKTRFYRNVETFDRDSVMLYGNGYEAGATISDGDVKAVRTINSWPAR
jgi:hypothetical protein